MVMAFEGWNDAGDAASTAARRLSESFKAEPFAELEAEPFYDFTAARPFVKLGSKGERTIEWPENIFSAAVVPDAERDLIFVRGVEPQLKWRTFSRQITGIAQELDVSLVVSLGALITDVAHSRPTPIYGTSADTDLCAKLDLETSSYEGPTGIVGVIHDACQKAGLQTVSLWATVPSYVPHAPSPKAALALIDRLGTLIDVPILAGDLVEQASEYETQINDLLADDDETRAFVSNLEQRYDESMRPESSAAMIEDLEKFLRDQG